MKCEFGKRFTPDAVVEIGSPAEGDNGATTNPTTTASDDMAAQVSAEPSAEATSAVAPATGDVIEGRMITDGQGNYFEPAEITAEPGDVLRFPLACGVLDFPTGEYTFQCDPHVTMGMVGTLTVQ